MIRCASALSCLEDTGAAIDEVLRRVAGVGPADLLLLFASPHHAASLADAGAELGRRGAARHVLAVTGETIVGEDREVEDAPALSVWAAGMPDTELVPFRLGSGDAAELPGEGWSPDRLSAPGTAMLVLADPFTAPIEPWLTEMDERRRGLRIFGGMASAAGRPGGNRLVLDGETFREGAVGMLVSGPTPIRGVVSQGCRPIGRPLIVTKARENIVCELGRRPALEVASEVLGTLDESDRLLVKQGLHLGRVINEYQEAFGRGDFLIRNVVGADRDGNLGLTDRVRVGQTVQFHLRDAATADEDLRSLLSGVGERPKGAILFSCNGRGTRLFDGPDHDIRTIHEALGPVPTAGFFAMGEFGPIGGRNFVHGFTASIALFGGSA